MAHLVLQLLGSYTATLGGASLLFRYEKLRALLAFLAVEQDRPHPRAALVGLLWPEADEADARRNLSQALFNLRQLLGEGSADPAATNPFLLVTRETIQFNPASDHRLDVAEFERLRAAAALDQAAELYRGDFLHQLYVPDSSAFEEWALLKREDFRRRAQAVLGQLTAQRERQQQYAAAQRSARRQLELEPWREESHRDLMRLLALSGERSAALAQYETCRAALAEELGVEPAPATRALYTDIRDGRLAPTASAAAPTATAPAPAADLRLPVPATAFVGRAAELAYIGQLLADPACRLLTLVGPGGIGKTRLALQAAAAERANFGEQVGFVPLTAVTDQTQLLLALAQAVGLALSGPAPAEVQLFAYLQPLRCLLVLDNFEQLSPLAPLLVELLAQAPGLKLLVTSREMLNVQGEWTLDVPALAVEAAGEVGALALFTQIARRARVGFSLTEADRPAAARVCELLGGLPLGIEIAASWTRVLSVPEIAQEIERDLSFLTSANRDLPERHRSLSGVLDQAWALLTADEQRLLAQLAVFHGGFAREAAQQVAGATLQHLSALIAKSLLRPQGAGRYDLHELVRRYAADRLAADPVAEAAAQQRHADYFTHWAAARTAAVRGPQQPQACAELRAETANWHAALQWVVAKRQYAGVRRLIWGLGWYLEVQGYFAEAVSVFQPAEAELRAAGAPANLASSEARDAFAFLIDQVGWFLFRTGQVAPAAERFAEGLALVEADREVRFFISGNWGFLSLLTGDLDAAQRLTEASLAEARALNSPWHMAIPLSVLGMVAQARGAAQAAAEQLRAGLRLWRTVGDPRGLVFCLNALATTALDLGQLAEARAALVESEALAAAGRDRWAQATALDLLGQADLAEHAWVAARGHFEQSVALHTAIGNRWSATQSQVHLAEALAGLGESAAAQALLATTYRAALAAGWWPTALEALSALAALGADRHPALSWRVGQAVLAHPAVTPRTRERAQQWHGALAGAAAQASAAPLEALAAELLATV